MDTQFTGGLCFPAQVQSYCDPDRARTCDSLIKSEVLYQLSYEILKSIFWGFTSLLVYMYLSVKSRYELLTLID